MTGELITGKIYYPSGALYFEGTFDDAFRSTLHPWKRKLSAGIVYYESGVKKTEGVFQQAGLLCGRLYYPSGQLKFFGRCNDKEHGEHSAYYGPSYPVYGYFYGEDGALIYVGKPTLTAGGVGYPKVIFPAEFGKIDWM